MITQREILNQLDNAASMRKMETDTIEGLNRIQADITHRYKQIIVGLITLEEGIALIKHS